MKQYFLHEMYDQRKNFVIVALTGITGSGCSDFAELMAKPFGSWASDKIIRTPDSLDEMYKSKHKQDAVFARKYKSCYEVCSKQYNQPFEIIKYRNVLIFCCLREIIGQSDSKDDILRRFGDMLSGKFHESYEDSDKYRNNNPEKYSFSNEKVQSWGLSEELIWRFRIIKESRKNIYFTFFSSEFNKFCSSMFEDLKKTNYFAKNYFIHRLGYTLRSSGRCEATFDECKKEGNNNLFIIVNTINEIIKGCHEADRDKSRRFVIDSIRSSMEIMYLRERYNAFYMVALHNDGREYSKIKEKVSKYVSDNNRLEDICHNINVLNSVESDKSDFEEGSFYSPDISKCVSDSEIHISYNSLSDLDSLPSEKKDEEKRSFFTYGEQWMKFYSLIIRPGLITPSRDERCMAIAYVAKFNSGCISRQVGCTIVDSDYAVQSVGWNDPPSAQMPCALRYVDELCNEELRKMTNGCEEGVEKYRIYSKYESTSDFASNLEKSVNRSVIEDVKNNGLPFPFCFRSRYNSYKGNKDQVNTRSLHAEENTMLRISRNGGMGLKGGTMYVTASPCVLCSKKAYQIGIRDIVYLDPYTDIAPDLILNCGFDIPNLRPFRGAIGSAFYKFYQPFMPYKDELAIIEKHCKKE